MKINKFLDINDYGLVQATLAQTFVVGAALPDYIFRKRHAYTLMADFDRMMGDGLPLITHNPLFSSAADRILLSVLDPEPITYFHKTFGKINSFVFESGISEHAYGELRWLSPGNPSDAIQFNSNIVVWICENQRWAMWGERETEIAVIGFDDPAMADFLLNDIGHWTDAETALGDFASMPYRDHKAPEDFARALIENYGSRADLERKLNAAGVKLKPGVFDHD